MVGDVGDEAERLVAGEDGRHQVDVGQVGAAARVGIVDDEHVAGREVPERVAPENLLDRAQERAEVHGDVLGLGDHPTARVEDRRRAVAPLLDIGRVRGADEGGAHLLRHREERRADDLERDAIHGLSAAQRPSSHSTAPAAAPKAMAAGTLKRTRTLRASTRRASSTPTTLSLISTERAATTPAADCSSSTSSRTSTIWAAGRLQLDGSRGGEDADASRRDSRAARAREADAALRDLDVLGLHAQGAALLDLDLVRSHRPRAALVDHHLGADQIAGCALGSPRVFRPRAGP